MAPSQEFGQFRLPALYSELSSPNSKICSCSGKRVSRDQEFLNVRQIHAVYLSAACINETIRLMPLESRQKVPPPRMVSQNILPLPIFSPFPGNRPSCWR